LAPVLVNYQTLTPEQEDEIFQRLLRLFRLEHEAGVPLKTYSPGHYPLDCSAGGRCLR
jgi:hypothetical protein